MLLETDLPFAAYHLAAGNRSGELLLNKAFDDYPVSFEMGFMAISKIRPYGRIKAHARRVRCVAQPNCV